MASTYTGSRRMQGSECKRDIRQLPPGENRNRDPVGPLIYGQHHNGADNRRAEHETRRRNGGPARRRRPGSGRHTDQGIDRARAPTFNSLTGSRFLPAETTETAGPCPLRNSHQRTGFAPWPEVRAEPADKAEPALRGSRARPSGPSPHPRIPASLHPCKPAVRGGNPASPPCTSCPARAGAHGLRRPRSPRIRRRSCACRRTASDWPRSGGGPPP